MGPQGPFSPTGPLRAGSQVQLRPVLPTLSEDRVRPELFPIVVGGPPYRRGCCYAPGTRTGARDQPWAERTLAVGLPLKPGAMGKPSPGEWRAGEWSRALSLAYTCRPGAEMSRRCVPGTVLRPPHRLSHLALTTTPPDSRETEAGRGHCAPGQPASSRQSRDADPSAHGRRERVVSGRAAGLEARLWVGELAAA